MLDLDQFYTFIATDALIGNQEGGLQSGRADDAGLYRGILDPRFKLVPHDFDDVFNIGNGAGDGGTRSIFSYDILDNGVQGLRRLFTHPQLVPRYYAKVLEQMETWFTRPVVDPLIEQVMGGWVPPGTIATVKAFVDLRRANVLNEIQQNYSLNVSTGAPDVDGFKRTNDGSATLSGTFNVARTYSITVNGQLAQWFYRASGQDAAGTWKMIIPAGGGAVIGPGLNHVVVKFWDAPNGAGNVVQQYVTALLHQPATPTYTNISGTLAPAGSLAMIAPATYVPGVPFLARIDLKDGAGALDRTAWNRTVNLAASNGATISPATMTLTNGMGSALLTVGGGGAGGGAQLIQPGGTSAAPNPTAPQWRMLDTGGEPAAGWKSSTTFADGAWRLGPLQAGAGDVDERTLLNNVPTGGTTRRAFYFRQVFDVPNPALFTGLTIRAVIDDGAVFYLNGTQVATDGMPGGTPTITTPASSNRSGAAESQVRTFDLTAFLGSLVAGDNLLAVEVHNFHADGTPSNDLSFDCELIGALPSSDPGNFTLTGTLGALSAQKSIVSLGANPAGTSYSGTLPAGATSWSGVVRVTGDVTVPNGATLNIAPGTHILVTGTAGAGNTAGSDIIVQTGGIVNATGTFAQPISITAADPTTRWGEINTNGATTTWQFCLLSRACHAPGGGHTGTGPAFRLSSGASITIEDSVVSDLPGKTLTNTGATTMTFRRSHFARCVMGPETDASGITIEDCNFSEMLPAFRESGGPDDEDCIYIHDSGGRPVTLRRSVFSNCGDDALDFLAGSVTVEDCIVRNAFDKGVSLLNNNATFRRTLIIDNDIGISGKGSSASTFNIALENCTIVGEEHLANTGDGTAHSIGIHARNKPGQGDPGAVILFDLKNCIIVAHEPFLHDAPYPASNTTASYTASFDDNTPGAVAWPGVGNIAADPQFVDLAGKDFHLTATSPARDTGDPASPLDADGSRADMGALPFGSGGGAGGSGVVTWTPAGGPYRVTANTMVPPNLSLVIQAGTAVYFDQNVRLTVNGNLQVLGTPERRVTFSHVPGTNLTTDVDPIKNGTQTGTPKWGGIRIYDSLATENVVKYADFINAQGTDPATAENFGSLGFIRSWGFAEGLTFAGTHLRMLYGRNCKLTVIRCNFPDMFLFDSALGRIEVPNDFLASADNRMEPLKVEYPVTDPEVAGNANFPNGLPAGGHWRVYYNDFHGNRGHQDVFDADSGRWNQPGQFVLDCRYNYFHGLSGDEHIDLGGDAFIASNRFEFATKDPYTIDTGYSNAISSGDKGSGTTILVARNVFYELDHAINCKIRTATIFEHNTCVDFHQDWQYNHTVTQLVAGAAVNLFVPNDGNAAGDGAYLGYNIFFGNTPALDDPSPDPPGGFPRLISWPDQDLTGTKTSVIQLDHNFVDLAILDTGLGVNHPGGIFAPEWGTGNVQGNPMFVNKTAKDFNLAPGSAARGTAPGGLDYGATLPEWAYILGGPSSQTASTSASFTIGGPGIVAYKWRLDGGAWSVPVQIGGGGVMPRSTPIVRQAALNLPSLANGVHTLEVLGQDMAGNWQDADPAKTVINQPQAGPTTRTWAVNTALPFIRLNEVLADGATTADAIELYNGGASDVNIGGWTLSDDPLVPAKFTIPVDTILPAGGFLTFLATATGIALDRDGDSVFLGNGTSLVDSITFGQQVQDLTIGRIGAAAEWMLGTPTLGSANAAQRTGDVSNIRINEWFTDGDVLYDNDWVELANPGALPVNLSGLRLTDNHAGSPAQHIIAPLSFIAANGFAKFIADGRPELSPAHLSFMLDAEQEQIALFNGNRQLDLVFFFPQTTDYSMGRDPSTSTGYTFYELPTAGLVNGTNDPAYANALALLRGLRITEIMFNPIGGPEYEFIELRNVGSIPLQLGGVQFVEGIEFTFPAMALNPGQTVVLVSNLTEFRGRYGASVHVGGVYLGRLDNTGETLGLQLPPPFDANILTFSYDDGWQPITDGLGRSLVIRNPLVPASSWKDPTAWQASSTDGGDPDGVTLAAPDRFPAWMTFYGITDGQSDTDNDGLSALLEYALGTHPLRPSDADGAASLPQITLAADGRLEFRFIIPGNPAAAQLHGAVDLSYTIEGSNDLATWAVITTKTFPTNWSGPATVTVSSLSDGSFSIIVHDVTANEPRYLRLRVGLVP